MVVFVFVVGYVVMLVTGGAMVVACFVVGNVPMLVMGEVRSPCYNICKVRKRMRGTKQWVSLPYPAQK
jgi:hypothetical protein